VKQTYLALADIYLVFGDESVKKSIASCLATCNNNFFIKSKSFKLKTHGNHVINEKTSHYGIKYKEIHPKMNSMIS